MRKHRCPVTTPGSNYPAASQGILSTRASYIISVLRAENHRVISTILRFAPEDVGTHSLRSGGATAMSIKGVPYHTVIAIGPVALDRIYGLYSTTDLILQRGSIDVYDPTTLVLAPLSILLSTEPIQHPIHTLTKPRPVRLTE